VGLGVDLAAQDLLGAGHGQRRHLLAQRLLGARDLLVDVRLGGSEDAVGLGLGGSPGLVEICASRFSAEAMISPTLPRALASSSPARLPAASSSCLPRSPRRAVGDRLLAFLDGPHQRRPDD